MELSLKRQILPYLQPTAAAAQNLEESAECIVPDSSPDIERVLDTGGMVLLRGKECREGCCTANGSVRVWVLYLAEGESTVRRLELSIPFSGRLEHPSLNGESTLCFHGSLCNLDTRVINPRKIHVRARILAELQAWTPAQLSCSSGVESMEGVQCRVESRRVVIPVAAGEKPFVISDELELPQGQAPIRELLRWDTGLEITESRLVGEKAVFKGSAVIELLYTTEQGGLETWQTRLPFSQYLELPGASDEDSLRIVMVLTGAELEPDGFGSRLQLTLNSNAQCVAEAARELSLLTDLYSLTDQTGLVLHTERVESLLDRQNIRQDCRELLPCPSSRPISARVLLEPPVQRWEGDQVTVAAEGQLILLYQDSEAQLQSISRRTTVECQTILAANCSCRPELSLAGELRCLPSQEGVELHFGLLLQLACYADMELSSVESCEMTELPRQERRPSLVVRMTRENETLWNIAKECRSSVEAITAVNCLDGSETSPGMLLLIPRA